LNLAATSRAAPRLKPPCLMLANYFVSPSVFENAAFTPRIK